MDAIGESLRDSMAVLPNAPLGIFVRAPDDRYVGKLIRVEGDRAEVSFFHSLALRETAFYSLSKIKRWFLYPQTRVYVRGEADQWRAGRVRPAYGGRPYILNDDRSVEYEVQLPGGIKIDVSEKDLEVRCLRPRSDPAEVLALRGGETQFFHDRRWPTVEALTRLQAADRGLAGLTSAAVEFVPHQVYAVQRVLQDPLPRYLLADEVGLGKTIEAGAILRQWTIDDPSLAAVVLAPAHILGQWHSELANRFRLDLINQVKILAHEQVDQLVSNPPAILIVDEAHRLAEINRDILSGPIGGLAKSAQRLLLLSATPSLADERAFFSLLQLLDPDNYKSSDFNSFHDRLERRQEYGRLLLGLRSGAATFLLKQRIDAARRLFPDDQYVQEIVRKYSEATSTNDQPELIAALRNHIADTYRIHQRVLRARRSDCAFWFKPRGPEVEKEGRYDVRHVRVDTDEDHRIEELAGLIEDWRVAACRALESADDPILNRELAKRFRQFVESLGEGVGYLARFVQSISPIFDGEADLLGELNSHSNREISGRCRAEVVAHVAEKALTALRRTQIKDPKIVCFCSSQVGANDLAAAIEIRLGEGSSLRGGDAEIENILKRFSTEPGIPFLVLDRKGEEGLNLHFAHALVHGDLPISAERLEQRIGRLDRFGRHHNSLPQYVVLPTDEDGPWIAWLELLQQGFALFNRSVSDVQFVLKSLESDIESTLLREGASGLRKMIGNVKKRIDDERQRLDEQNALDELALSSEAPQKLVEMMDDAEADEADLERIFDRWLVDALQFNRKPLQSNVFEFGWKRETLLPSEPWTKLFSADLDRPLTWRRRVAMHQQNVALLRPGAHFIEALTRQLRWDDRGTAFITWRVSKEFSADPSLYFKLCFVVEAAVPDRDAVLAPTTVNALRRRAAAMFPPITSTLYLDSNLNVVDEEKLVALLRQPYDGQKHDGGRRDFNVGDHPQILDEIVDSVQLANICRRAASRGLELMRERQDIIQNVEAAIRQVNESSERSIRRNKLRVSQGIDTCGNDEATLNLRLRESIVDPDVRVDSIGIIILVNRPPPRD